MQSPSAAPTAEPANHETVAGQPLSFDPLEQTSEIWLVQPQPVSGARPPSNLFGKPLRFAPQRTLAGAASECAVPPPTKRGTSTAKPFQATFRYSCPPFALNALQPESCTACVLRMSHHTRCPCPTLSTKTDNYATHTETHTHTRTHTHTHAQKPRTTAQSKTHSRTTTHFTYTSIHTLVPASTNI